MTDNLEQRNSLSISVLGLEILNWKDKDYVKRIFFFYLCKISR